MKCESCEDCLDLGKSIFKSELLVTLTLCYNLNLDCFNVLSLCLFKEKAKSLGLLSPEYFVLVCG